MATRRRDLLKKGKIQISSLKACNHLQKSWKLGFYNPLPFISQFSSSNWVPIFDQTEWMHLLFGRIRCSKILRIGGPVKSKRKKAFFLRMRNAKICDVWPKMCFTYVVYVCSDILLSECYLGLMERWGGEEASKTELKDMFKLFNDKRYES